MNPENMWEARLRHWTPRRPSANLKDRLFGRATEAAEEAASPGWNWLAPVGAAFLFSIMALTPLYPEVDATPTMGPGGGTEGWIHSGTARQNVLTTSFSWTNHERSLSSIGSFLLYNTNGLKY